MLRTHFGIYLEIHFRNNIDLEALAFNLFLCLLPVHTDNVGNNGFFVVICNVQSNCHHFAVFTLRARLGILSVNYAVFIARFGFFDNFEIIISLILCLAVDILFEVLAYEIGYRCRFCMNSARAENLKFFQFLLRTSIAFVCTNTVGQ